MLHQLLYTLCRIFLILMSYDDCSNSNSFHLSAIVQQFNIYQRSPLVVYDQAVGWYTSMRYQLGWFSCWWSPFAWLWSFMYHCYRNTSTARLSVQNTTQWMDMSILVSNIVLVLSTPVFVRLSTWVGQNDNFRWSRNNDVYCLHSLVVRKTLCRVQFRLRLQSDVTAQWLDRNWYISPLWSLLVSGRPGTNDSTVHLEFRQIS